MAQKPARSEDGPEGPRKPSNMDQDECIKEQPGWKISPEGTQDPWKGLQQAWETQWQGFLKTLQASPSRGENSHILETPWDDAKAFLASFEQVAEACRWPREEWVARLLPALSEEAQQAFNILKAHDKEDYGKVKAAILREFAIKMEMQRLHFRQFRLREVEDPRRIYRQLQELCCQWLKPERHTKEQILELLILEQFLTVLPPELQSWVREGGPENFSQAAALVEDFLMSQHHVGIWKWQEPLQRMIIADTEETVGGKQIYADVKHSSDGDAALLGTGSKCPSHSNASFLLEGPEIAKANLTQELMNLKETSTSLHMVEQTRIQPGQQTMFWQVMQEDGVAVQSLEGLLVPKPDLPSHLEKKDEISVPFPGENELLPGHDAGNTNRSQIKVENSEMGGTGMLGEESQWELPAAAAIIQPKSESHVKQKPVQGKNGASELPKGHAASVSDTFSMCAQPKKPLVSKFGRKYSHRSELYTQVDHSEFSTSGKNVQQNLYLDDLLNIQVGAKSSACSGHGRRFPLRTNSTRHRRIRTGKQIDRCPVCGKSFSGHGSLPRHLRIHTGERPYRCPQCEKCFRQKPHLLSHQRSHTGEKPFQCCKCGKNFTRRCKMVKHQKTHRGPKEGSISVRKK